MEHRHCQPSWTNGLNLYRSCESQQQLKAHRFITPVLEHGIALSWKWPMLPAKHKPPSSLMSYMQHPHTLTKSVGISTGKGTNL